MKIPHRTAGGRRTYEADDVLRLCYIRNARRLGFSTIETGEMLATLDSPNAPCKNLRDLLEEQAARVSRSIAELNHLKSELAGQISSCYSDCCDGAVSNCSAQKQLRAKAVS
jgi:DNA-binding transcriptional MerR regulator